jgi:ribonuclease G
MVNDSFSFDNVYVDDDKLFNDLNEYVGKVIPDKAKIIKKFSGKTAMFDHFNVTRQVKALFGKNVSLKSGGYLIIEHTEALHVIDVNSGNMMKSGSDQETSALEANLEAAEEIARQLRLRDMGGIIVVDFIDMQKSENRQALFDALKGFMKEDRAKHNVLPPSKIGLVQITRERVRPVLDIETKEVCPTCNGTGKVEATILIVDQLENAIKGLVEEHKLKEIVLEIHPFIESYLTKRTLFTTSVVGKWQKSIGVKIKTQGLMSYGFLEYNFYDKHGAPLEF